MEDLWRWRAIRPLTKAAIHRRGLRELPHLQHGFDRLPAAHSDFGRVRWRRLAPLFEAASAIKPTLGASPVFASKLCHFMRPDLFVVVDRELVGLVGPYERTWGACSSAWRDAAAIQEKLRAELRRATQERLDDSYPFATKITELCAIGAKQVARSSTRPGAS